MRPPPPDSWRSLRHATYYSYQRQKRILHHARRHNPFCSNHYNGRQRKKGKQVFERQEVDARRMLAEYRLSILTITGTAARSTLPVRTISEARFTDRPWCHALRHNYQEILTDSLSAGFFMCFGGLVPDCFHYMVALNGPAHILPSMTRCEGCYIAVQTWEPEQCRMLQGTVRKRSRH